MKADLHLADLFCGGGGFSTGTAQACYEIGKSQDVVAVNHWDIAAQTYKRNHPNARVLCTGLDTINPTTEVPGGRLNLLAASPECTHHANARGGRPMNDQSRASAWLILKWLQELYVESVLIENVHEFDQPIVAAGRRDRRHGPVHREERVLLALHVEVERLHHAPSVGRRQCRHRLLDTEYAMAAALVLHAKEKFDRIAYLEKRNKVYCDWNNDEREDCRMMEDLGHPLAPAYREIRGVFDHLKHAANAGARFYTLIDDRNCSELWAPEIHHGGSESGVYPAMGDRYYDWLRDQAAQGWPARNWFSFSWIIHTTSARMQTSLRIKLAKLNLPIDPRDGDGGMKIFQIFCSNIKQFREFRALIDRAQGKRGALPGRDIVDDLKEAEPLPMSAKSFSYCGGHEVIINPRGVLAPLIPIDYVPSWMPQVVNDLAECVRQGLPWTDQVDKYFKTVLKPESFRVLKKELTGNANGKVA